MINYEYGVYLDRINVDDLRRLKGWRNNPSIYKWCRQDNVISDSDQYKWHAFQNDDPTVRMFLIKALNVGKAKELEPVGVCGLTSIDHLHRRAEFSLYIGPEHHQQGLGKDALMTLLSYSFYALNMHIIWGECFDGNPALNLFKKVGMKVEGTRRDFYFKDGRYLDAHLISIKADEFKS